MTLTFRVFSSLWDGNIPRCVSPHASFAGENLNLSWPICYNKMLPYKQVCKALQALGECTQPHFPVLLLYFSLQAFTYSVIPKKSNAKAPLLHHSLLHPDHRASLWESQTPGLYPKYSLQASLSCAPFLHFSLLSSSHSTHLSCISPSKRSATFQPQSIPLIISPKHPYPYAEYPSLRAPQLLRTPTPS